MSTWGGTATRKLSHRRPALVRDSPTPREWDKSRPLYPGADSPGQPRRGVREGVSIVRGAGAWLPNKGPAPPPRPALPRPRGDLDGESRGPRPGREAGRFRVGPSPVPVPYSPRPGGRAGARRPLRAASSGGGGGGGCSGAPCPSVRPRHSPGPRARGRGVGPPPRLAASPGGHGPFPSLLVPSPPPPPHLTPPARSPRAVRAPLPPPPTPDRLSRAGGAARARSARACGDRRMDGWSKRERERARARPSPPPSARARGQADCSRLLEGPERVHLPRGRSSAAFAPGGGGRAGRRGATPPSKVPADGMAVGGAAFKVSCAVRWRRRRCAVPAGSGAGAAGGVERERRLPAEPGTPSGPRYPAFYLGLPVLFPHPAFTLRHAASSVNVLELKWGAVRASEQKIHGAEGVIRDSALPVSGRVSAIPGLRIYKRRRSGSFAVGEGQTQPFRAEHPPHPHPNLDPTPARFCCFRNPRCTPTSQPAWHWLDPSSHPALRPWVCLCPLPSRLGPPLPPGGKGASQHS
ncbi:PREDICTED: collagen alpha-1(I) chain-like [Chrysochloris asiatica]|uniref:Collagen alpha-1(I) chain-like n=1 Tax=Chrysochloris asiatica TaxID=185453 RepID=A0A9B0T7U4_CHRAS|nr:PREDICTED: collagen alpha-1(I) chain-like [Chrysochloris asiatica]